MKNYLFILLLMMVATFSWSQHHTCNHKSNNAIFLQKDNSDIVSTVLDHIDPELYNISEVHELWDYYLNRPHPNVITLEQFFNLASDEFDVPVSLLKAIGYVENNWTQVSPSIDKGWGIMHLTQNDYSNTLTIGSKLIKVDEQLIKDDAQSNIRAGAAILKYYSEQYSGEVYWVKWFLASRDFAGLISNDLNQMQAETYFKNLCNGYISTTIWGEQIKEPACTSVFLNKILSVVNYNYTKSIQSTDYGPAISNPAATCNYSSGRSSNIDTWVNHWIGTGTYAGAISWFQNCSAVASAHFVIRASDGQITQCVPVSSTAYHAGASGYNNNSRSIGIEHEATTSNPSLWNSQPLLQSSTSMACYFSQLYNIPQTRSLPGIRGHGEMPGTNTACPGTIPWTTWMSMLCSSQSSAAPSNDNCSNATTLPINTSCSTTSGTVSGATSSGVSQPTCSNFTSGTPHLQDVWYKIVANSTSVTITAVPNSSFDMVLAAYTSCSGTQIGCADSGGGNGGTETMTLNGLNVGQTYYIRVYDYGAAAPTSGTFTICATGQAAAQLPSNPQISGTGTSACSGSPVTLTASATGNNLSYQWSNGQSGSSITVTTGGNYTCTISNSAGQVTTNSLYIQTGQAPSNVNVSGNTSACNSVSLTASCSDPSATFTWSNGTSGQQATFTTSSQCTVSATNACGSASSQPVTVTVNTAPQAPTISATNTTVCMGTSVQIQVQVPSNCQNCQTVLNPGNVYVSNGVATVYPQQSGSYTATSSNSCGSSQPSNALNISVASPPQNPTIQVGSPSVCAGADVSVSITNQEQGVNYQWSNGQNGSQITIYGIQNSQSLTVTATRQGCTQTAVGYGYISVLPAPQQPTITGSQTVCQGATTILSISNYNPSQQYVWGGSGNGSGQSITTGTAGQYMVTVSSQGCSATSTPYYLNSIPNPPAPMIYYAPDNVSLITQYSTGSIQWFYNGSNVPIYVGSQFTPTQNGSYMATYTDPSSGCTSGYSQAFQVVSVGVDNATEDLLQVHISPNPATNNLSITVDNSRFTLNVSLIDILGQVLISGSLVGSTNMNIESIASGTYLIVITNDENQVIHRQKIIIRH